MSGICVAIALLVACGSPPRAPAHDAGPPAPAGCRAVAPGVELRELARTPNARLCLMPGWYPGPIAIAPGTVVWGPRSALVDRREGGTVVEIGAGATLLGATVDGSGGVFDREDAAVRLADDARVEGVTITNAVFGVLAERVSRVTIRKNTVLGDRHGPMGLRGDTIRLWETQDSVVTDNVVDGGRDLVVWYSDGNRIERNRVANGRYGTHLMYSHRNRVAHNVYANMVVGVFVMYSHDVAIVDNIVREAGGSAGMAVGLKDSGNIRITGNAFVHDHTAVFVDNTPLQRDHTLVVDTNLFGRCDVGVMLHGQGRRSRFTRNDFIDNGASVVVEGGGDASAIAWSGNYWSDYTGYDLDGDGVGDIGFELRSLEGDLVGHEPELAFFHGTPALAGAEAVTRLIPMYAARSLLVDPAPRMRPRAWEGLRAD